MSKIISFSHYRFESGAGSQFYQFNYGVKERRAVRDRMFR
nr:MAG TPA: hypothetical protein [Caudoviricetes sp.]